MRAYSNGSGSRLRPKAVSIRQSGSLTLRPPANDGRGHRPHERGRSAVTCDRVDDSRTRRDPPIDHNATGPDSPVLRAPSPRTLRAAVSAPATTGVTGNAPPPSAGLAASAARVRSHAPPTRWFGSLPIECVLPGRVPHGRGRRSPPTGRAPQRRMHRSTRRPARRRCRRAVPFRLTALAMYTSTP